MITLTKRLMHKVEKTESCWLFTGAKTNFGYGTIQSEGGRKGRTLMAHRGSWEIHIGKIPLGKLVLHKCDNPPCVNPSHLFLGTQKDNVDDMRRKGRNRDISPGWRGEKAPMAKLTEAQVKIIRKRYSEGEITTRKLGKEYGISCANVSFIINRKRWAEC